MRGINLRQYREKGKESVKTAYTKHVRNENMFYRWFGNTRDVVSDHWGRIHRRNKRIFCDNFVWLALVSCCRTIGENKYRISRYLCHNIFCRCCRCFWRACCNNKCCVCLSRVPYDSLIAFFFLAAGASSFGYFLLEAVSGVMDLLVAFLGPSIAEMVPFAQMGVIAIAGMMGYMALWVLIIGIAATGPTRRTCCGRYGCRLYGRIIIALLVVACYFFMFLWLIFISVLMIPTIFAFIVDQACALDIVKEIQNRCLDMTKLNELLGYGMAVAMDTLTQLMGIRSVDSAVGTATGVLGDIKGLADKVQESLRSRDERYETNTTLLCADELYKLCRHGTGLWLGFAIACGASMIIVVGLFHTLPVLTANYAHIHDTPDRKKKKRQKIKNYSREMAAKSKEEKYVIVMDMTGEKKAVPEDEYRKQGLEILEKHRDYPEYRHFNYPRYQERNYPPFVPVTYVDDEGSSISGESYFTSFENVDRGFGEDEGQTSADVHV
ncbi:uncharacterized protein [Ptychodera flava]|uniref:uncharacterized protein n=1 Tax=Ptychodera flava TaxID=63121 RepID=UPI00396A90C6